MNNTFRMNSFILVIIVLDINCINICGCITMDSIWNVEQNSKEKRQSSTSAPDLKFEIKTVRPAPKLNARLNLGMSHGKLIDYGNQYMAYCKSKEECDAGIRMICKDNRCSCKPGELFFEWPKYGCFVKARMFDKCEVTGQCMAMNPNTYCNPENGRCTCSPNYFFNGQECSLRYDNSNLKAQEVYKAAVVAAACFIVAVVGIFVACIVRRSFCRREQQLQQSESNRNSDIFSISDEIAALRAVDKPPSYEEVLQIERTFYGIPPPEYTGPRNEILPSAPAISTCAPDPDSTINPPFQSTNVITDSGCSLNESTTDSSNLNEISRNHSHFQSSDIVTAAEVLPVPSDFETTNQNMSSSPGASSHIAHSTFHSSTPPPRLHSSKIKHEQGSSSLPSSPYLSTISSRVHSTVVDFHTPSRNGLLKQDSETTQPDTSHLSSDSFLSHSETSSLSEVQEVSSTSANAPEYNHSVTVIAYDNYGFESDLYL